MKYGKSLKAKNLLLEIMIIPNLTTGNVWNSWFIVSIFSNLDIVSVESQSKMLYYYIIFFSSLEQSQ